jgi:glucokinase
MSEPTDRDRLAIAGVDLGGTKIAAAFVGPNGERSGPALRRNHSNAGPDAVIGEVATLLQDLQAKEGRKIDRLGVGVAAQVDRTTGLVIHAPNLRWRNVPFGSRLAVTLGAPVTVLNDARAATVGEWRHGAGRGVDDLLTVFVGTGVGGSVVLGGTVPEGADGAIGEVGHTILFAQGRKCHCPGRGCLEAYASGWAIAERAREAIVASPQEGEPLLARAGGLDRVSAESVGELARVGDPLAHRLFSETLEYLGSGVAGLVNAFNPRRLLLGGGVVEGWPEILPAVQSAVRAHCQPPARDATVLAVGLGSDSVLTGAASWARHPGPSRETPL